MENSTSFKPNDPRLSGNKYGIGNNGGRPRTVSLAPEEMIELGEEMIAWVAENKPLHLSQWYCFEKHFTEKQWDTMQQAPEFFPYYEHAIKLVGLQYISKHSDVEPSLKQRWQRVYFKDLRREENETAAYNASLSKQDNDVQGTEEQNKKLDALMDIMKGHQSSRKKAKKSNKTDKIS